MSGQRIDITVPGRPEVHEVSAGIYAYVQPDGRFREQVAGARVGGLDEVAVGDEQAVAEALDGQAQALALVLELAAGDVEVAGHPVEGVRDASNLVTAGLRRPRLQVARAEPRRRIFERAQPAARGSEDDD